jgi:hypothetical protein
MYRKAGRIGELVFLTPPSADQASFQAENESGSSGLCDSAQEDFKKREMQVAKIRESC